MDKKEKDKKDSANMPKLTPVEKLLQDNQISRAVDLIRGINLFSKKNKILKKKDCKYLNLSGGIVSIHSGWKV